MKIVIPAYGLDRSGGTRVLVALASELGRRGHDVLFVSVERSRLAEPYFGTSDDVKLLQLQQPFDQHYPRVVLSSCLLYRSIPECDVILANYCFTLFPALLSRRGRVVYYAQGYEPDFFSELHNLPLRKLAEYSYRLAPEIVAVSRWVADRIERSCNRRPGRVVNPCIDDRFLAATGCVGSRSLDMQMARILFVGNWESRVKGATDLLEALEQLGCEGTALELTIAGASKTTPRTSFPVRVVSPLSADMPKVYHEATMLVSPSRSEGFALPPLEAMASGVPVIVADSGGVGEYARDGHNAIVVPAQDPRALADAIRRVLTQPRLRRTLADNGQRTARHYTLAMMTDRFEEIFADAAVDQLRVASENGRGCSGPTFSLRAR